MRIGKAGCLLVTCIVLNAADYIPADTSYTVKSAFLKARRQFPFIKIAAPDLPPGTCSDLNRPYSQPGVRTLHLDLFYPDTTRRSVDCPGILLVHGGGWRSGTRQHMIPLAMALAGRGFVTAAVEYRLSSEARYPAAVLDLMCALRWMRVHAGEYGLDTSRLAILGGSAGGQLAALAANTASGSVFKINCGNAGISSRVQAVADLDGLLDFTCEAALKFEDDPDKNPSAAGAWFGGRYHEVPDLWQEASPLTHCSPVSPPILFLNSSIPRFHAGRDEMAEQLKSWDIYYEIHTLEETPHTFWLFHPWFDKTVEIVDDFLKRTLNSR